MVVRTFDEECAFVKQVDDCSYAIEKGFVPNMRVPGHFYVNDVSARLLQALLQARSRKSSCTTFLVLQEPNTAWRWICRRGGIACERIPTPGLTDAQEPRGGSPGDIRYTWRMRRMCES